MSEHRPGVWEYDGETKMFWDGQVNEVPSRGQLDAQPRMRVQCAGGHEWDTVVGE
jgi:hypothetical protein